MPTSHQRTNENGPISVPGTEFFPHAFRHIPGLRRGGASVYRMNTTAQPASALNRSAARAITVIAWVAGVFLEGVGQADINAGPQKVHLTRGGPCSISDLELDRRNHAVGVRSRRHETGLVAISRRRAPRHPPHCHRPPNRGPRRASRQLPPRKGRIETRRTASGNP
jgi:hypothetical protein